ncbi:hypothetical protein ACET3Z_028537 [Daucus carota]
MKIQVCSIFTILLLFLTISSAADPNYTSGQDFVQCLIRSSSTSISKVIYTSQNSTYTSVLKFSINNLRFDTPTTPKPIVIVKPVDESQIQTVIYCCKKHDIQMRIRGGGHDYEGLSYVAQVPFVLLDMINLRSISVDPVKATAWVGAGATLGELYYHIGQKSDTLGFPAGIWSTVGVSGLVSGGGYADDSPAGLLNRTAYKIPFKAKSDFVDKPISREGLEGLWKILLQQEPGRTNFLFTSYGGKMAEISESAIPFPHRAGTLYMMYMRVRTDGDTMDSMKWIRGLYKYLTPYVTSSPKTAYVNYNDLDLGVNNLQGTTSYKQASKWGKKYFKNNFDRLVIIKSVVDPDNFFRHQQSIPPFS